MVHKHIHTQRGDTILFVVNPNALESFPNIERALLFGSRAKGNFQPGSDVDIALVGKELGDAATRISGTLNDESPLPYYFDILCYDQITSQDLRDHIERVGIPIYQRP